MLTSACQSSLIIDEKKPDKFTQVGQSGITREKEQQMITPTIKIKKEARNAARSHRGTVGSTVKRARHSPNKEVSNNGAISAYGTARSTIKGAPLSPDELDKMDAYWRASLYLCVGMLYLKDNPLLRKPLKLEQIKARLLGHWGSDAGQSFTYTHFNRLIKKYDLNSIFISGPGHGAPAVLAQAYLEGTYSEVYPDKSEALSGMQRFFKQFSFPGGIGSHATPETPGSIHEGGELGYSVSHAYGTVYDNPDLITLVMVGDGESETGPLATSWHSNKFLNPITDGAVLPVLHLNGYKINNPTLLARISHEELEGFWRAHQIPIPDIATNPAHLKLVEEWMRGYKPEQLFDEQGQLIPELKELAPKGRLRMSANPVANGGLLRKALDMPKFRDSAV